MDIRGKVAFVSGANRGLGHVFVKSLLEAGASKVYAAARDISSIDIRDVQPVELDITNRQSVVEAARICPDVELLVNNAGYMKYGSLLSDDAAESLRTHFEINAIGTLLMAQAFAPVLAENGGGAMINILSVLSWLNILQSGGYSASKSAQWSLTNGLRDELRRQNTLVMGVHPGYIDTDMAAGVDASKSSPEEVVRLTLQALGQDQLELIINDKGQWVKQSLSKPDAIYLTARSS
ncbi:putative oxidoreductase [Paraburkholderia nemoris]|uniref:SDR family oxidoreductase n=1 Tax=Paraburkholderia nemoris TaxID=2793076 RepID=UPI001913823D|nr:SDR family oxidoreductase [Paraburkholderia nemoris]MBK5148578.1 SDR family oxidoreductase [Burkholderia sp. R-69608]CAE6906657.1 putative oxidoreductase [Paraburkholderia nemoris]